MGEPIVISEYDPRWPRLFCELRDGLPAGPRMRARSIEHIGSTAVPGLAAAGYPYKGDAGVPGRAAFDQPPHLPEHHLYVCVEGAAPLVAHLRLRDHLRANPGTAREYAALKRELAAAYGDDRAGYTEAKTAFIEAVLAGG